MKFPKLFGKKTSDEDEYEDEDEIEEVSEDEEVESGPSDDEDEDEEGEGGTHPAASRKILFLAIGGGGLAAVLLVGGVAWWIFGGSSDSGEAAAGNGHGDSIVLDIPARPGENQGKPQRPGAQQLSATDTLNAIAAMTEGPGAGIVVQPVQLAAYTGIPAAPTAQPLAAAPDPDLTEQSAQGPLPKIASNGKKPWQVYARPFPTDDKRPRIAIVVEGLGMSSEATQGAIAHLPAGVTLAFDPYATGLSDWASKARAAGHEVLLGLPMEPADFPVNDPGPQALTVGVSTPENLGRLTAVLSRMSGYVGVISLMGSRFLLDENQVQPILDALNKRGLLFVQSDKIKDSVAPDIAKKIGLPIAETGIVIDDDPSRAAINRRLTQVEEAARRNGSAVALASPYPVTVERLLAWAGTLQGRGLALAPVSAVVTDK